MVRKEAVNSGDEIAESNSQTNNIDLSTMSVAEIYDTLASQRKARTQGGVTLGAAEARAFLHDLMNETNQDRLVFSVAAQVLSAKKGRKLYNQLRSAVTAKESGFVLDKDIDGTLYVVRE